MRRVRGGEAVWNSTVLAGLTEPGSGILDEVVEVPRVRVRRPGGSHKRLTDQNPALVAALEHALDPVSERRPGKPASLDLQQCGTIDGIPAG